MVIVTSPRFGAGAVAMEILLAEGVEGSQLRVISVVGFGPGGLLGEDGIALLQGQLTQLRGRPPPSRGRRGPFGRDGRNAAVLSLSLQRADEVQHFGPSPRWQTVQGFHDLLLADGRWRHEEPP